MSDRNTAFESEPAERRRDRRKAHGRNAEAGEEVGRIIILSVNYKGTSFVYESKLNVGNSISFLLYVTQDLYQLTAFIPKDNNYELFNVRQSKKDIWWLVARITQGVSWSYKNGS